MSASYHAYLLYGCHVELSSSKPNPRYGKHRYDPDTGERIEEFIVTHLRDKLERLIAKGPSTKLVCRDSTDARATILGIELAEVDVGVGDDPVGFEPLTPEHMETAQQVIIGVLRQLKVARGDEAFRYYLVGCCSY